MRLVKSSHIMRRGHRQDGGTGCFSSGDAGGRILDDQATRRRYTQKLGCAKVWIRSRLAVSYVAHRHQDPR